MRDIKAKTAEGWQFTFLGADEQRPRGRTGSGLRRPLVVDVGTRPSKGAAGALQIAVGLLSSPAERRLGPHRVHACRAARRRRRVGHAAATRTGRAPLPLPRRRRRAERPGKGHRPVRRRCSTTSRSTSCRSRRCPATCAASPSGSPRHGSPRGRPRRRHPLGDHMGTPRRFLHRTALRASTRSACAHPRRPGRRNGTWTGNSVAVRKTVEQDPRPFVWVDDDIDFFQDGALTPQAWADDLSQPSLLIAPKAGTGLMARHLDLRRRVLAPPPSRRPTSAPETGRNAVALVRRRTARRRTRTMTAPRASNALLPSFICRADSSVSGRHDGTRSRSREAQGTLINEAVTEEHLGFTCRSPSTRFRTPKVVRTLALGGEPP